MYKFGLKVKDENVIKVLEFVAANNGVSRAEISAGCGVSPKTVNKVLRLFLDKSLFVMSLKKEKTAAGQRPYRFRLNPNYNYVVCYFHDNLFRARLFNTDGRLKYNEFIRKYKIGLTFDDLKDFLVQTKEGCQKFHPAFCLGYAAVLPEKSLFGYDLSDPASKGELTEKLEGMFADAVKPRRFFCDSGINFVSGLYPDAPAVLFFNLDYCEYSSALFKNGERDDKTLAELKIPPREPEFLPNSDPIADEIAFVYMNAKERFGRFELHIDSRDYLNISGLAATVRARLDAEKTSLTQPMECSDPRSPSTVDRGVEAVIMRSFLDDIAERIREPEDL